jgi:hypothetical protein
LIELQQGVARSLNSIGVIVRVPDAFRSAGPLTRVTEFGGHPYLVSVAAFVGKDSAVMIHAEQVQDGSGASNYDELPAADWPDASYRIRGFCLSVTDEEIAEEHDLKFLRDSGWNPAGTIAMDQYLRTSDDHNQEVVISVLVRGVDCAKAGQVRALLKKARQHIVVN